jgi:hypothetical protein
MSNLSNEELEKQPNNEASVLDITPAISRNDQIQPAFDKPSPTIISTTTQDALTKENSKSSPAPKLSATKKLLSKLPTYNQFKKTLKADIALTVTLVLVLDRVTNIGIGQGTLLTCIAMIFFCPVKPIGLQVEVSDACAGSDFLFFPSFFFFY